MDQWTNGSINLVRQEFQLAIAALKSKKEAVLKEVAAHVSKRLGTAHINGLNGVPIQQQSQKNFKMDPSNSRPNGHKRPLSQIY